ncbi:MAG: TIR domain-containing protein [Chthoniobacter sp.]
MITPDKRFFASYAREDRAMVQPVLALLRAANPDAFLELDAVLPENRWPERLDAALMEATTFIVFWSWHASKSEFVKGEWQSALAAQKEIVPVVLDTTPLPEPLQARSSVEFNDLARMKENRGAHTAALLGGVVLILAAAAVPLVGWELGVWGPGTAVPSLSKNKVTAPDTTIDVPNPPAPQATAIANVDRESRLRDLLSKGRQLRESGDSTAAITQFQEAATLDDKNPVPFVELAVTEEAMGGAKESLDHWRKVHELGSSAGLYFSLAEAKLKAANALPAPGDTASGVEESPDLTAPIEGIANGSLLGLLPVTREDQLDGKSAARFVLHIPVKARPKAHIDVHELIIHVLFYEIVDGRRIEETSANVKSHWLNPPADWVGSEIEQLEVEYQLPKPPTAADVIVDRKYYGYIIRLYYKELLQASVAEPAALAKLHPAPPTATGEPAKPPAPKQTPAPLPQGAFHQTSQVGLSASAPMAAATPSPTPPSDEKPTPTPPPARSTAAALLATPLPWILSSVLLACLAVATFIGARVARRRHRLFNRMIIELAARRLAATLAEPIEEQPIVAEEVSEAIQEPLEDPAQETSEELSSVTAEAEGEPATEQQQADEASTEETNESEQSSASDNSSATNGSESSEGDRPARP